MSYVCRMMFVVLPFLTQIGQAAEHRVQTSVSASKILINKVLMRNAAGVEQYVSVHLTALDRGGLRAHQRYSAVFRAAIETVGVDGRYNETNGVMAIGKLLEGRGVIHKMKLRREAFNQFLVMKYMPSVVENSVMTMPTYNSQQQKPLMVPKSTNIGPPPKLYESPRGAVIESNHPRKRGLHQSNTFNQ